ncbi:MAG: T9SS type A sorting domain-containing protein [Paludibacter sp.]
MPKSHKYIALFTFILINYTGFSTNNSNKVNCKYEINVSQHYVDGNSLSIKPGDTICILAGTRKVLQIKNLHGDSLHYIVFKNSGGDVVVENYQDSLTYNYGISIQNCSYFKFTGTGTKDSKYGIKILKTRPSASGLSIDLLSTNFEIDHLEIAHTGFAGIFSISQPTCDETGNRGHFVQKNVSFHDNYIHNTGGEGMYIGHSFYNGYTKLCDGVPKVLYPHEIHGIRVFNNKVDSSGWDGIQVSCATSDCEIHHNTVTNYGIKNEEAQKAGIQLGAGTTGRCYNNAVLNGSGTGINVFGMGNNIIYNNIIVNPGRLIDTIKTAYGIFCDDRNTTNGLSFNFINNTIIAPKTDGIRIYSNQSHNNKIINNLILKPGSCGSYKSISQSYIFYNNDVDVEIANNFFSQNLSPETDFDILNSIYTFTATLPIYDNGRDVSNFGISNDYFNVTRPLNGSYDIGAIEFNSEQRVEQKFSLPQIYPYPNPNDGIFVLVNNETAPIKRVTIYSSSGIKMHEEILALNSTLVMNLQKKIQKGFYLLKIDTGYKIYTNPLIIR